MYWQDLEICSIREKKGVGKQGGRTWLVGKHSRFPSVEKGPRGHLTRRIITLSCFLRYISRILVVGKQKKISSTSNYRLKFDIDMFLCTVVAFLSTHCFLQLSTRRLLLRVENYSRKFFFCFFSLLFVAINFSTVLERDNESSLACCRLSWLL